MTSFERRVPTNFKTMLRAMIFILVALLTPTATMGFQSMMTSLSSIPQSISVKSRCRNVRSEKRRIQPSCRATSTRLYSTKESSHSNSQKPKRRLPNPLNGLKGSATKLLNARARLWARFQALPRRAKRVVIAQMLLMVLAASSITKKIYVENSPPPPIEISYSSFLDLVDRQAVDMSNDVPRIDQVRIGTDRIVYRLYRSSPDGVDGGSSSSSKLLLPLNLPSTLSKRGAERWLKKQQQSPYLQAYTRKIPAPLELVNQLRANDIAFSAAPAPRASTLGLALRTSLIAVYFLMIFRLYKTMAGNMGGKGDSPGKLAVSSDLLPRASFDEIQGIDGAKVEVMELVDVLRNPSKYAMLGARAPTGLLLVGPPGTGKTMLARATAATAGVPLLYCSGSDFVEMFVGRGAARIRQLFQRAQKLAPCIIFVDELDALGKSRDFGGGFGGAFQRSNDEAEQTLNQLLACMDGLDSSRQICVLAATNRKEVLDPALIRPGRFDRIVKLELPNAVGRERILRVHTSKLPGFLEGSGLDTDRPNALGKGRLVDLSAIAAVSDGFSGAELEFLVNEAAIRAVRRVSSALQQGISTTDIVPHVEARDFEDSLKSFYETRKPKSSSVNDILKNVWKQP